MTTEQTLASWITQEAQVRKSLGAAGPIPRDVASTMSGMELFEAIISGELPSPPICETLDFVLVHVSRGTTVYQGKPLPRHFNPLGTVHGGWFCTLLDSAMGCAVHTMLPAGKIYTTLEIKVNMIRALTEAVPLVRAEGKVIHAGRQSATAEGRIVGSDGKLYAHATTTCLILEAF